MWKRTSDSPPTFDATVLSQGHENINSLSFLPPSSEHPQGLVVSGARDAIIEVRALDSDHSQNAHRLLIGHANNVCALDTSPDGKYIVSGGWDGQGRVWSVEKWETAIELQGHGSAGDHKNVWAVLAYDERTVITGCADSMIRIYNLSDATAGVLQPARTLGTTDIVRALCRVPRSNATGADFASAGNDGIIRLWNFQGEIAQLHGHESFIYCLDALPSGELVSSGEDRSLRIWRGTDCVQTITHPAISVWSVAVCHKTGDIVSGASDRVARVFTRDPARAADAELLKQFDESVQASSIPQEQMPAINKEKLPGPEYLQTRAGTKEGQNVLIREEDGSVTAHQWAMADQSWVKIGTVVESAGSSGRKEEYQGKMYDFVFSVDIEEGKPPLKLPYNLSQNPYEAATKFLENNKLPMTYLDTVSNFIVENTKGAKIGQSEGAAGPDPYGTENRYQPGGASRPATLDTSYLFLFNANFARKFLAHVFDCNLTAMFQRFEGKSLPTVSGS
jgi:phospholipase A-2-activating protein